MGALLQCYYLFHGKRYCFLDLNARDAAQLLEKGCVVHGGRWYSFSSGYSTLLAPLCQCLPRRSLSHANTL